VNLRRLVRRAARALREATGAPAPLHPRSAHHGRGLARLDAMLAAVGRPTASARVAEILARKPRARILEVGCGEGHLLLDLLAAFGERVDLCGINAPGWEVASRAEQLRRTNRRYQVLDDRRLAALPLPRLLVADVQDLAALPERDFDLIVSLVVLPHVRDKARALEEMARRLAPEGRMIHHLDSFDLAGLDFVGGDLPRFVVEDTTGPLSALALLERCGLEVAVDAERVMIEHLAAGAPLQLGLALDAEATVALKQLHDRAPERHLWGVQSRYRLR